MNEHIQEWDNEDRLNFIRKVYGILSTQLLVTALVCILPYISPAIRHFLVTQFWLVIVAAVLAMAISCALVCMEGLARQVPTNYILLFTFTLLEAYSVAFACAIVNDSLTVLAAAFMTAGIVVALTLYAVFTKTDFTACGGFIAVLGGAFFIFSIFSLFFGATFRLVIAVVGVIIFGVYLIFDTQYVVGGRHRKHTVSRDDYVLGAMILYIDIIQIFMYILEIFMNKGE